MGYRELCTVLEREARQQLNIRNNDIAWDFHFCGDSDEGGTRKRGLILTACPKADLLGIVLAFEREGINVCGVTTAVHRALTYFQTSPHGRDRATISMIVLRNSLLQVYVIRNGNLTLLRITKVPLDKGQEIQTLMVGTEVRRSFLFYKQQYQGDSVRNAILIESENNRQGLVQSLSGVLEVPVEMAVGADLYRTQNVATNLFVAEVQPKRSRIAERIAIVSAVIVTCAIFSIVALMSGLTLKNYRQMITERQRNVSGTKAIVDEYGEIRSRSADLESAGSFIRTVRKSNQDWVQILGRLSRATPPTVFYRSLNVENGSNSGQRGRVRIDCVSTQENLTGSSDITQIISNLRKTGIFSEVVLLPIRYKNSVEDGNKSGDIPFSIACVLK
jgi:hypothetical protein